MGAAMVDRRWVLGAGLAAAVGAARAAAARARPRPFDPRDLDGTWDLGSYTDLQRPAGLPLVLSPEQAEAYEAPLRKMQGMKPSAPGEVGQAEAEFNDRGSGLMRVAGQARSSTIVDPPDGRLPFRPAARALAANPATAAARGELDNPETQNGPTQCLASVLAGAPMLGAPDANLIQILSVPGQVAILAEKYHDVRIVRLDPRLKPGADPPGWLGSSVGRWEGASLVVETAGFHAGAINRGQGLVVSPATHVVERFTRAGADEIAYAFTVQDPDLWTRPWRGEMTLRRAKGRLFEYACHEGNYSLPGILAGARREEREARAVAER